MPWITSIKAKLDDDGESLALLDDVTWIDSDTGESWTAPKGHLVNGLSVPRFFWRWQSPLRGLARKASVIHDYYYDPKAPEKSRKEVDDIFYKIMREDGVLLYRAWIIWAAVRLGGSLLFRRERS